LKPANVLIDSAGRPSVTDFGLIKMLEKGSDWTVTGAILGTPSYMSPEQAAGQNQEVGPQSDVYSLGAILYELVTGRPPFRATLPLETLVQVLESEPVPPRHIVATVPIDLELICQKALAKAPHDRYASASELADDLERFLRGESVSAAPHSWRRRLVRWARQEPGLVSRLAIFAAGAIVAQAYYPFNHPVTLATHCAIMGILAVWALIATGCQLLLRWNYRPERIRPLWLCLDGIMLTTALIVDGAFDTQLVLCYGAIVVAAGLWFRVSLVWLALGVSLAGYVVLIVVAAATGALGPSPQHHVIAAAALVLIAIMVSTQVQRVRALSRYYEGRSL
jgi:serine/threonine-protein kinase